MTSSDWWHDSSTCVTWLIHMCCTTQSKFITWLINLWHDSRLPDKTDVSNPTKTNSTRSDEISNAGFSYGYFAGMTSLICFMPLFFLARAQRTLEQDVVYIGYQVWMSNVLFPFSFFLSSFFVKWRALEHEVVYIGCQVWMGHVPPPPLFFSCSCFLTSLAPRILEQNVVYDEYQMREVMSFFWF